MASSHDATKLVMLAVILTAVAERSTTGSAKGRSNGQRSAWAGEDGYSLSVTVAASPVIYLSRCGGAGSTFHTCSAVSAIQRQASIVRWSPRWAAFND
jgi:hypothetical protein